MSLYFALWTVENNEKKKSVKFQVDMLLFVILFRFMYLPQIATLIKKPFHSVGEKTLKKTFQNFYADSPFGEFIS